MQYKLFGCFILLLALTQNLILSVMITGGIFFLFVKPEKDQKKKNPFINTKD